MYVLQSYAAVYGEIVNTLFALLYERVAEKFPSEVFSLAVHFFHGLVHWHSADRNRTVAYNPLACFVYVVAG